MPHSGAATTPQQPPRDHHEVLERYRALRHTHQLLYDALLHRLRLAIALLVAAVVIIFVLTRTEMSGGNPVGPLLGGFVAVVLLLILIVKVQAKMDRRRRLLVFYDRAIDRCDNRANGIPAHPARTGEDALPPSVEPHLYARDLDITGDRSIFAMLATTRTGIGERGLARYLLLPASHPESVARQQAVREILPDTTLRERIELLGQSSFQQLTSRFFDRWLDEAPPTFHPAIRPILRLTATLVTVLAVAGFLQIRPWEQIFPNLAAVLAIQVLITLRIRSRVLPLLEGGALIQGQVQLLSEGLDLLARTTFASPKLHELQRLTDNPAGTNRILKRLNPHLTFIQQRNKELLLILSVLIAGGSQAAIAISNWRRDHAQAMRPWLDAWGEFEALNAIATYAFEHPTDTGEYAWPDMLPPSSQTLFEAHALGHPLLPASVVNDFRLATGSSFDSQFSLISGSNMAGKSTLLRSIGVASVLAYAGAPVRAASLRLTPFAVGASIALTDSLAEGKSKFLAEVERLAAIVRLSATQPVLFLVDEIFSGTNSLDRRTAAAAVLRQLLANGAIGALSTHDLALTSLASAENRGINQHMASPGPDDPLAFDYRLKPGVNKHSNALAIIRLLGLEA